MVMRPGRLAGLVGALALTAAGGTLVAPGVAGAAPAPGTAQVVGDALYFYAGSGGANLLMISPLSENRFYVQDSIRFTLGSGSAGCTQTDGWSVTCLPAITRVIVDLGDGNDEFHSYSDRVYSSVKGGYGSDQLWGWLGPEALLGGPDDDELYGLSGVDRLWGDEGNDLIEGHDGLDYLWGGTGNDTMNGGADSDVMYGEAGTDWLSGGAGPDDLDGGPGAGSVRGDDGNDVFRHPYGQAALATSDYWGGAGTDRIAYLGMPTGVAVSLNNRADDIPLVAVATGHNVHDDIETVDGSDHDDSIVGSDGPNTLRGLGGNDVLSGLGGDDLLDVQSGNNQQAYGGAGTDTCTGNNLFVRDLCELPA